jgi:hypothetical protein
MKIEQLRRRIPYRYWLLYDGVVLSFLLVAIVFDLAEWRAKRGRP